MVETDQVAVIAGVGPGLGRSLCVRFARAGFRVAALARRPDEVSALVADAAPAGAIRPIGCDVADPASVSRAFAAIDAAFGPPACTVFNAGTFQRGSVLDTDPAEFERCWRVGTFGGFLVAQAAAKRMVARGQGTILMTGATASWRGGANFVNLAAPKFGLRAVAQSLARELGPQNIHVAHVIVDGQILAERTRHLAAERASDALLDPDAMAETYFMLHAQHRSAWTFELDLRPWVERF